MVDVAISVRPLGATGDVRGVCRQDGASRVHVGLHGSGSRPRGAIAGPAGHRGRVGAGAGSAVPQVPRANEARPAAALEPGVREEAARGLAWRAEYGRGGTEVGVARARDLSNGSNISPDTIGRMVSYFARHAVDSKGEGWSPGQDGFPSAGRIAWALWGGDAGRTWANKVAGQMDREDDNGA